MIVLKMFCTVMFGSDGIFTILSTVVYIAGLWKIFAKCGIPSWYALIPCLRTYQLARCADREPEGRIIFCLSTIFVLANVTGLFLSVETTVGLILTGLAVAIAIAEMIYLIRIYRGLCDLFGCRKRWIWIWLFAEYIPGIIWGFSGKYQPRWQVKDIENEVATYFSGDHVDALDRGLTVNLEERTVSELFKKKYLLRDIHMYIKPGSMVLLLGGSGAGKTTLVNTINGYEPAKAEITLNGSNVYKEYDKMLYDVGFVPQQELMRGDDTVYNTLSDSAMLRLPRNFSADDRRQRIEEVMEIFGLLPVKNSMVDKLSGGQKKRLSIAMEFISDPTLFILDEPDSGLDGVMARELMQQLRLIADRGKIVIVITHTPDRVVDLFNDVIVLAKDSNRTGRLAFYGSIEEARSFFGREKMEEIVKSINRVEEGGEGRADEFIKKYAERNISEVRNG